MSELWSAAQLAGTAEPDEGAEAHPVAPATNSAISVRKRAIRIMDAFGEGVIQS